VTKDSTYRDTAYGCWSVGASTNGENVRIDICPRVVILHGTKEGGILTTSRATKVEWEQIAYSIDMAIMNANDEIDLDSTSGDEWAKTLVEDLQSSLTSQLGRICRPQTESDGLLLWDDTPQGVVSPVRSFSTHYFSSPPVDNLTFRMNYMAPQEEMLAMLGYLSHGEPNWGDVVTDNSQMLSLIIAEHPSISTKTIVVERNRSDQGQIDSAKQGVENGSQLVTSQIQAHRILRIPQDLVPFRSQPQTSQGQTSTAGASVAASEDTDLEWEALAAGMSHMSV
jgi:hypothetical protein